MRLKLILPVVEAKRYIQPEECPYGCGGREFFLRQEVKKQVCDTTHHEVKARRYKCCCVGAHFVCTHRESIKGSFRKEPLAWL